jgi:uncharacterized protein (DUF488 family)
MTIFTAGYEGLTLDALLQYLAAAGVATVVDVRDMPLSRKPGFSKSALAAALTAAGIQYLHVKALGCPKPIRDRHRQDGDWQRYTRSFMAHMRRQSAALQELALLSEANSVALLCYERDPGQCHRAYVARAIATITGAQIAHIGAAGVIPDRATAAAA